MPEHSKISRVAHSMKASVMSGSANVRSLDAIRDFRSALIVFLSQVADALLALQEQVFSAVDWVENEQPRYWDNEVLRAYDNVSEARIALETNRLRKEAFGHRPSLAEEKAALEAAKRRLAYCQQKVEIVKQAGISLRHEADEFLGRLASLQSLVDGDLPKMIGMLERMIAAIESYTETGKHPTQSP